jgi:hypothetical protein
MATISFEANGPLVANIYIGGPTVRDVEVVDLGDGQVSVELGGVHVGARFIGDLVTLHTLMLEADRALVEMRRRS